MGGFMQPQGHVQVLLNGEVFGMDPQEALDSPRFCIGKNMPQVDGALEGSTVYLEDGITPEVVEGLAKLGHDIKVAKGPDRMLFG
jgi:gamma-glutamyltranspeptidase / glutathione hydrolase